MKFKKLLAMAAMATLTVPLGMAFTTSVPTVQGKTWYTLKNYPKSIRGTWYTKTGNKMYVYKITSRTIRENNYVTHLKSRPAEANVPKKLHKSWSTAESVTLHHQHWINLRGWNQSMGFGVFYRQSVHQLAGKKRSVLQIGSGYDAWIDGHAYRSRALAKKYSNHHFAGERYRNY